MTFDTVFPIEEPTFLWTHTLTYRTLAAGDVVVDAEGHWVHADTPETTFTGYLTAPNPREIDRAAARGVLLDAVCLAPHAVAVDDAGAVTADAASGVPSWLIGTYRVTVVRPNPSHLRILLTRLRDEAPVHDPGWSESATITPATVSGGA